VLQYVKGTGLGIDVKIKRCCVDSLPCKDFVRPRVVQWSARQASNLKVAAGIIAESRIDQWPFIVPIVHGSRTANQLKPANVHPAHSLV
jgi:hypothetical protein